MVFFHGHRSDSRHDAAQASYYSNELGEFVDSDGNLITDEILDKANLPLNFDFKTISIFTAIFIVLILIITKL